MIRLIFMVVAFLMMLSAVIGGLYFWGFDPLAKFNELIGNMPGGSSQHAQAAPSPTYVDFGLLVVPVVQGREVRKQAELILRLDVTPDKQDVVVRNLPRLQSSYLQEMMAFLPTQMRDGVTVDEMAVRRRLTAVSEKTVGPGLIRDVVIEQSNLR